MNCAVFLLAAFALLASVEGHGRFIDPPSRASMWRYGFNTPPNYDDNQLFCGGYNHQWNVCGGRCGTCGDPWDGTRHHEAGGMYATGTIARTYNSGQTVNFQVELTANHWGWFEFRICPNNNPDVEAPMSCLDANKLQMADGSGTRYTIPDHDARVFTIPIRLPSGMRCSQCVIQWKYHTANSWDCDDDGTCCTGCGPQEEFYGCSDVTIN